MSENMMSNNFDGVFSISDSDDEDQFDDVEIGDGESTPEESEAPRAGWKKKSYYIVGLGLVMIVALLGGLGLYYARGDQSESVVEQPRLEGNPSRAVSNDMATTEAKQEKEQFYVSPPGDPIPVSIRLINPSIMKGYPIGEEGCMALAADVYNASAILANEVIKQNVRNFGRRYWRYYRSNDDFRRRSPAQDSSAAKRGAEEDATGDVGEDAYGTNNQEEGVDEADIMQSDGKHVYTAYGDILVVWNAKTGKEVSRTKMPERKVLTQAEGRSDPAYYNTNKVRISGLLLDSVSKRIVVIVSGYSLWYQYDYLDQPVFSDNGDTRVLLYDISSLPADRSGLTLISSQEMDGQYSSARKIGGVAHIVRQSTVDHWRHIDDYLSRHREEYASDNKETYAVHATTIAKQLLDGFARRVTEELKGFGGGSDCSAVTKVALYASGDGDINIDGFPDSMISGILESYLQVSSFEIASPGQEENSLALNTKSIGSLFPSSNLEVYASNDVLVVAGEGHHHDFLTRSWGQSTYFLSFKLHDDGSAPTGLAIGNAPGYLLNQFAMDEHAGYLRVATTERSRWGCVPVDPSTNSRHSYWHWPHCRWEMASESKSRLSVFKFPVNDGRMELVKTIDNLGVTEEIKCARFFDDKAYLVTFMRTDPLYTIDFSDPENPEVTNELKISGFSSYLHPINPSRLLAIGKEANETTGIVTGFQITLFNVSDLENTTVLQRYTIGQRWASSSAENDHLAFRFLPKSNLLILPISIETSWWTGENQEEVKPFDGFQVFSIADEKIEHRFSIRMTSSSRMTHGCWYDAYLPARSMVFGGNLTVAKGHGYASYDISTERKRWKYNLDRSLGRDKCSGYWG